jgi:hypothetical protein
MTRRFPVVLVGLGVLPLLLFLSGCVARWTPEQGAALTATARSYMVPTPTTRPPATVGPTPKPQPSPTAGITPTPVSRSPESIPGSNSFAGVQPGEMFEEQLEAQLQRLAEAQ